MIVRTLTNPDHVALVLPLAHLSRRAMLPPRLKLEAVRASGRILATREGVLRWRGAAGELDVSWVSHGSKRVVIRIK